MAADAKPIDLSKIRNIGVIAHIDAGKTTTTEHLLYYAGAKHRLGAVDEGTTETDWNVEEQERGITIYSACIPFQWRDCTINLIDTPGHVDFTAEVERSLRVLDGCVVVFDAQKGVEAQSETVWRQADKYQVPRLVFINKMDVVGANFENALQEIRERLEGRPVPVVVPIGSGSPKDSPTPFRGVIDLIEMKALFFDPADHGKTVRVEPIPEDQQGGGANLARAAVRRADGQRRPGPPDQRLPGRAARFRRTPIRAVLREQTLKRLIQPVLCGSGREHVGIQPLLDAVTWYLPSPLDRPPVVGVNPKKKDKEEKRRPDPKEPFCGLVFKIVAGASNELFYVRIYSGTLRAGKTRPYNPGRDVKELVSKIYHTMADPKRPPGAARGAGRRHRGDHRLEGLHHRRHALRLRPSDIAGADPVRRGGLQPVDRAGVVGRQGQAGVRAEAADARGSDLPGAHRPRNRPDDDERHGQAAPGDQAAPHGARLQAQGARRASRASAIGKL